MGPLRWRGYDRRAQLRRVGAASAVGDTLLHEVALELSRLPLDEHSRGLHKKALALKQLVDQASSEQTVIEAVRALHLEVRELSRISRTRIRLRR